MCAVGTMLRPMGSCSGEAHGIESHVEDCEETRSLLLNQCGRGKGAVLVCPHTGSWEMAAVIAQTIGIPIFLITGRQTNPLVDRYLNRLRCGTGIAAVQRGSGLLKSVIRKLRSGEVLAFLPDVRAPQKEIQVQFLGREANVPAGMALLARQAGVPIIPVVALRVGWIRHSFRAYAPVQPDERLDKATDWQRMTQEVFRTIDGVVREQPEQWFWYNKRWILDPLEAAEVKTHEPEAVPPDPGAG